MNGETNLAILLKSMQPTLLAEEFVFITLQQSKYGDAAQLNPIAMFMESEGMTLVIPKARADQYQQAYSSVFKCITLNVHSSLDAVGLTAAFATRLTEEKISANVIAGFYHDHIFVQAHKAQDALVALRQC
ncbi:ACT domain-containing protein [Pseudoalteromonas sp. MMG022]|uniref:ACT domain-containing protein n=1 Tax=Pseudoalteromonas sp. MMG022 TaxID=2909978 RepID=UPI001F339DDD|nr:ACT domain-containing protein [Pseudoalteromonas sp. MMG022]MCF6437605.1 ACT domain-containing protein [Pseudoalteromonas sp. MMG022]